MCYSLLGMLSGCLPVLQLQRASAVQRRAWRERVRSLVCYILLLVHGHTVLWLSIYGSDIFLRYKATPEAIHLFRFAPVRVPGGP